VIADISYATWAALAVGMLVAAIIGCVARTRFPTAGDLLHALLEPRIGRWVFLLGWLWLGWHLLVRTSHG
jgi:uncharacterized protein DUF6186